MIGPAPMCYNCKHFRTDFKCDAFPRSIPRAILLGGFDHRKPYRGDKGIQFDPKPDTNMELIDFIYAK